MKRMLTHLMLALSLLISAAGATAHSPDDYSHYRAVLSGPAESPPNTSYAWGLLDVTVDRIAYTMDLGLRYQDLSSPATQVHLHCCTPQPLLGTAPPATRVPTLPLFSGTSGTYGWTLNLNDAATYNPDFIAASGGTVQTARDALLAGMEANQTYFNIHTERYPAGEIRGFLVATPVPEPASWTMMLAGLAGVIGAAGLARRGRRRG